jgi:PIN domain nuclease of toxin-antitoxin system
VKILLDTNALIWWLHDSARLGQQARRMIAGPDVEILVSIVSLWEISMKWRVSKMEFSGTALLDDLADEGIEPIPVLTSHILALDAIGFHHRDPFDHLLLAQARVEDAAIITSDREMALYGVRCIPAGR